MMLKMSEYLLVLTDYNGLWQIIMVYDAWWLIMTDNEDGGIFTYDGLGHMMSH